MESPDRRLRSAFGESDSNVLALSTLIAALGFTPWAWGTGVPWAQFVFRVLGLTALCVVSLGHWRGVPARSQWASRLTRGVVLLLGVSGLSAALSIHRGKSLEAMLNLLAIIGLFLAAATAIRGARWARRVALIEVLAAIPVAAYGIAQHFRPELLPAANSYPGRALGPFGQPNRLGGYLIAAIPVAVALALSTQDRTLKVALMAAVFGLMFCLVSTYSRGAWIGLLAGLAALAVVVARWPELSPRAPLAAAVAACLILPAVILLPSIVSRLRPAPAASTAQNLPFDPERQGSPAMRRAVWEGALRATARRPVTGYGIGAFREAFDRFKGATMKRLEAEGGRTADQAHGEYLAVLTERGALGLAAFVAVALLGLAAAWSAVGAEGSPATRWAVAGVFGGVVALLAHAVFEDNLSFVPHGTVYFADLGLIAAVAPGRTRSAMRARPWALAGVVAAVVGFAFSGASFAASREADAAFAAQSSGRADIAAERLATAGQIAPWNDEYAVGLAHVSEALALQGRTGALAGAEASYRRALRVNASDPVTRHELARLYLAHPDAFGEAGTRSAITELNAALTQNPYYAEIRNDLGVALLRAGDRAGALEAFRRAGEGRAEFVDPLLNLAAMAMASGDRVEARQWLRQALARDPESAKAQRLMAALETESR
jgi:O-antigen ligase